LPRDQTPGLRQKVVRARATWDRTDKAARAAHKAYRVALMKASDGGVTKADLARDTGSRTAGSASSSTRPGGERAVSAAPKWWCVQFVRENGT